MIEILECEQNSEAWMQARAGIPTASAFTTVMMEKGPKGGEPVGRTTYLRKLAGEVITGKPAVSYTNARMELGHELEPQIREDYAFLVGELEIRQVGFIRTTAGISGTRGASPDLLVGDDGMAEFKSAEPHVLIGYIEMVIKHPTWSPPEHYNQCQGGLWVAERKWIDLVVYWPGLPMFVQRLHRDEAHIRKLESGVSQFNLELAQLVKRIKTWGGLP